MQIIRNVIISAGVCLIGLLFVACSGSSQSAQVSQATPEATAIERSVSEATATKRPTIKVTASHTRTRPTQPPSRTSITMTRTIGPSWSSNTTPVADLLGLPATPITRTHSEQASQFLFYPHTGKTSPDGRYSALFIGEGLDILDKGRVRSYLISYPYKISDLIFSPDSSQLAFKVDLNPDNCAVFIVDLEDRVLRQAFHVSEWPNYTNRKWFSLQEWNAAGILIDLYDIHVGNKLSNELFVPETSQFETIGSGDIVSSMMSQNGRFVIQRRNKEHPDPPESEDTDIFLVDRENDTEHFIDEGMIRFSGFSSGDRYFAYSHFIENGKYRVVLLDLDTMTVKELVLDRSLGSLRSVEWYGNEHKLLLTISPQDGVIKYLVPIDNFDLDHLTPLSTP